LQLVDVPVDLLELAQRPLAPSAVLEDAGRLLDVAAPLLGLGVEDLVELPLPDDGVQLAAEPGVGEQLLDVERADLLAVDLVAGLTVGVDRARDPDLAELAGAGRGPEPAPDSRPSALSMTISTRAWFARFGSASRRRSRRTSTRRGPSWPSGSRAPTQRVDDVGLARPVRPDDDGDARLDLEHGPVRERLEADSDRTRTSTGT
jgi:hypothetical protein